MDNAALDKAFMWEAIAEASKGLGQTSPNPAVGAVLVIHGKIVARGHHREAGAPHAEIECLLGYGSRLPSNATLYVTLEPCSTAGRTPPCTQRLIEAGVKKIVVGTIDPNPEHSGGGLGLLRQAGVSVRSSVLTEECAALNEAFNKWIVHKRPFVIAKCGMTLDGRLTRPPGEDRWITSPAARRHANAWRAKVDAILIGAETLRADNPRLTVRTIPNARQPLRVVMTRSGRLLPSAHLFTDRFRDRTIIFRDEALDSVLKKLGQREITSVLIEGGGQLLGQAFQERVIDKVHIYVAPLFAGGPVIAFPGEGAATALQGIRLRRIQYEKIGSDIFVSGKATGGNSFSE